MSGVKDGKSRSLLPVKTSERPAKITWANIKAVIQAWIRKKRRGIGGFDLPTHMYEQIIWRRTQVMSNSPMCWHSGNCKVCGCEILGKTMEDRACSITEHPDLLAKRSPCYPEMMDEKTWEVFKKEKHIKLFE